MQKILTTIIGLMLLLIAGQITFGGQPTAAEIFERDRWLSTTFPSLSLEKKKYTSGLIVLQNYNEIHQNAWCGREFHIGRQKFYKGLLCQAISKIQVKLPAAGVRFESRIGIDSNKFTVNGRGSVVFTVEVSGQERYRSDILREGMPAVPLSMNLDGATEFIITVEDGGDGIACDQAVWADATIELQNGDVVWLGDLPIIEGQQGVSYSADLPFSFFYNERNFRELYTTWDCQQEQKTLDDNRVEIIQRYTDPQRQIEVRWQGIIYSDYPTLEWTIYIKNNGSEDTPLIRNVQAFDSGFQRYAADSDIGEFILRYNKGDYCTQDNYEPLIKVLGAKESLNFQPAGGRPTNLNFPYYNLQWLSEGVILVVGWPGQWQSQFIRDGGTGLHISCGQELTHFILHPGEEIRTPRIVVQFWKGQWLDAQNVWRNWMREYNMPRPGGKKVTPLSGANTSMQYGEMTGASTENQEMFIRRFMEEKIPLDHWWMDAGWYVGAAEHGWPFTGTWEVDKKRFPHGIREISDYAHKHGIKTTLWFEPERVHPETWLAINHPEWIFGGSNGGLLNLGNRQAREWLTDQIASLIQSEQLDIYRQDYNIDPLSFWRASDAENRQGIAENLSIQGYLEFWDELLRRNPDLLIDSCASGGRRNDIETMRRAVPFLRSDYHWDPVGMQCQT